MSMVYPSAAGRAWDRESSPVTDRRSATVPHNYYRQPTYTGTARLR